MTSLEQALQKIGKRLKDEEDHIKQEENYTQKIILWINNLADGSGSGDMVQ